MADTILYVAPYLYLWAALWTGVAVAADYEAREALLKRVIGPVVLGLLWPAMLPIKILMSRAVR